MAETASRAGEKARTDWTVEDLSSLLAEFNRAVKGLGYYEDGPARRDILARAFLAWQIELERSGPVTLQVDAEARSLGSADGLAVPDTSRLGDLFDCLGDRQVTRLRFDEALTRESFGDFAEWLAGVREGAGPLPGIAVNEAVPAVPPARSTVASPEGAPAVSPVAGEGISLGSSLLRPTHFGMPEAAARPVPTAVSPPLAEPSASPRTTSEPTPVVASPTRPEPPPALPATAPSQAAPTAAPRLPAEPPPALPATAPAPAAPLAAPRLPTEPPPPSPATAPSPAAPTAAPRLPAEPPPASPATAPSPAAPIATPPLPADPPPAVVAASLEASVGSPHAEQVPVRSRSMGREVGQPREGFAGLTTRDPVPAPGSTAEPRSVSGARRAPRAPTLDKLRLGESPPTQPLLGDPAGSPPAVDLSQAPPPPPPNLDLERGRLRGILEELEACTDGEAYALLAKRAADHAIRLIGAGHSEGYHQTLSMLADHASGGGVRGGVLRSNAETVLALMVAGERLTELIRLAAGYDATIDLRAAKILVQLGPRTVPALLESIEAESDPHCRRRLEAVFLALDDRAIPALRRAIGEGRTSLRRIAIRMAARVRHPELVPALVELLSATSPEARRLGAEALVQVGGKTAVEALAGAMASSVEGLPELAARSLGEMGDRRALSALLPALDTACRRGRVSVAKVIMVALAELQDTEAVPRLVSILDRSGLIRRRLHRELRVSALIALDRMPGTEARRAVFRALHSRDRVVREKAQERVSAREAAMEGRAVD